MAVNLAGGRASRCLRVALVDSDPQGSVKQWDSLTSDTVFAVNPMAPLGSKREIRQRVGYVEAMIAGRTVMDQSARSEARREIERLCNEILTP